MQHDETIKDHELDPKNPKNQFQNTTSKQKNKSLDIMTVERDPLYDKGKRHADMIRLVDSK